MEKVKGNDELRKALEQSGLKEGEYKLILTKELRFERIKPEYTIETVLPYPIPKTKEACSICEKPFVQHSAMSFFIEPLHIRTVRNFVIYLMEKLDFTKNMPLKLAVEAPSSVLNPKEIVTYIFELLREAQDVNLANHYIRVVSHYTPSEAIRYSIETGRGSLSQKLFQAERHYEALCLEWRSELQIHKQLSDTEEFNFVAFAEKHCQEVESDYFNVQADFHLVTARILAYEKLVKTFVREGPYEAMRRAIRKSRERKPSPTFPYFLGYPPAYGKRRSRAPPL